MPHMSLRIDNQYTNGNGSLKHITEMENVAMTPGSFPSNLGSEMLTSHSEI